MSRRQWQHTTRMLLALSAIVTIGHISFADDHRSTTKDARLILLSNAAVQKELKLTPDQLAQLKTKQQQARLSIQAGSDSGPNLMTQYQALLNTAITSTLNSAQQKRLGQLDLQRQAMEVITRPDIATTLKLTGAQKTSAAAILAHAQIDRSAARKGIDFRSASADQLSAYTTALSAIKKRQDNALLALLNADQKHRWSALIGAPFAL